MTFPDRERWLALRAGLIRLLAPAGIAVLLWSVGSVGYLEPVDDLFYDVFQSLRSRWTDIPSRVFLVKVSDREALSDENAYLTLLAELRKARASQILFAYLPGYEGGRLAGMDRFYAEAAKHEDVVVGIPLVPDPTKPGALQPAVDGSEVPLDGNGVIALPERQRGVARKFALNVEGRMTLEASAADYSDHANQTEHFVMFRGGSGSLPTASVERVLAGDLIPELLKGRVVLVGFATGAPDAGLTTSTTSAGATMSFLEFHGHALNTLLNGEIVRPVGQHLRLYALLVAAVLSLLVYSILSVRLSLWASILAVLGYVILFFLIFLWFDYWWPPGEVILCQGAVFLIALKERAVVLTNSMHRLIEESAAHVRDKYWPTRTSASGPSWSLVAGMLNQTLDLNKLIFLEADLSISRVHEIIGLRCSIDDITERRRDYRRSPYKDAIRARGPIRVGGFLKETKKDEEQYLAPLMFGSELLGFWALSIDGEKVAAVNHFDVLLRDYSVTISEILYQSRRALHEENARGLLAQIGNPAKTDKVYRTLSVALGLLHSRFGNLELLLNRLNTGIIVYDIFGRILQINEVMLTLLKKENLTPFKMNALDLIIALSDYDLSKSRRLLRRVVVENSNVSFPVTLPSAKNQRFMLHLKPLYEESNRDASTAQNQFGTKSILCEIFDTTSMSRLYDMKTRLTDRLAMQLRDDLATVAVSASLLDGEVTAGEARTHVTDIVRSKVRHTMRTLTECQRFLSLNADMDDLERFPIDPVPVLASATDDVEARAEEKDLTVEVKQPHFVSYVLGSAEKLRALFVAILETLCQDAADGSNVLTRVEESEDSVSFDFSNTGFGIPEELLDGYVFGDQPVGTNEFRRLRVAVRWVESWGGVVEARSAVGVGMHFTIRLAKFI